MEPAKRTIPRLRFDGFKEAVLNKHVFECVSKVSSVSEEQSFPIDVSHHRLSDYLLSPGSPVTGVKSVPLAGQGGRCPGRCALGCTARRSFPDQISNIPTLIPAKG